jgi:hypothetical protein
VGEKLAPVSNETLYADRSLKDEGSLWTIFSEKPEIPTWKAITI